MKAQLIFDLDNEDDRMEFKRCNKSLDMAVVLFEIENNLKKKLEYKIESLDEEPLPFTVLDLVFDEIRDLVNDINIEELIR